MKKSVLCRIGACAAAVVTVFTACLTVSARPEGIYKLGSKGPDVKEIQAFLSQEGYLDARYVTGFFGPLTQEAVKKYQSANRISDTGTVAELTLTSMFVTKTLFEDLVLRKGDEGADVKKLQHALCDMGYLDEANVTGTFGDKTEAAVKKFQKENNIQETGVAAEKTIKQINALIDVKPLDASRSYTYGDEDEGVKALQKRLCGLGYLDSQYVTGYYGAVTVTAVRKFQKNNQIPQTGTVAALTLEALNSAAARTEGSGDSKVIESIAKPGTLRFGDSGSSVKTLQENLKTLGYFSGTATGEFGDVTKTAVIRFQKASSLTADGIVNNKTLTKIAAAVSAKKAKPSSGGSTKKPASPTSKPSSGSTGKPASPTPAPQSGYNSANMTLINSALKSLSSAQLAEVELMAKIIKREVGSKSYRCQLAVGSVIMNRVKRDGTNVKSVIYAKNQFSTANSSLPNEKYSTSNYYAAIEAYMGVKPLGNILFFCSSSMRYTSYAGKNRTFCETIDNECFFY